MTTQNVTLVAPGTIDQRIITVDTGAGEDAPLASKVVAAISFTAWTGVLAGGRFLGFFKPPQHWCPWCGLF